MPLRLILKCVVIHADRTDRSDQHGVITQWNTRAEDNTGIAAKDALGRYLWDAHPIVTVTETQVNEALKNNVTP